MLLGTIVIGLVERNPIMVVDSCRFWGAYVRYQLDWQHASAAQKRPSPSATAYLAWRGTCVVGSA